MGREIFCQIREAGKSYDEALWDSADMLDQFVCGRDDATTYIAIQGGKEGEIDISAFADREKIRVQLKEYADHDKREIDKAKDALRDLKAARRNARNYTEFSSFTDAIEGTEEWIERESWSRAQRLIDIIDDSAAEFAKHKLKYRKAKLYLVISE